MEYFVRSHNENWFWRAYKPNNKWSLVSASWLTTLTAVREASGSVGRCMQFLCASVTVHDWRAASMKLCAAYSSSYIVDKFPATPSAVYTDKTDRETNALSGYNVISSPPPQPHVSSIWRQLTEAFFEEPSSRCQFAALGGPRRRPIVAKCPDGRVETRTPYRSASPPGRSVGVSHIDRGAEQASRADADDRIVVRLSNVFVIDWTPRCQSPGMINVTLAAVRYAPTRYTVYDVGAGGLAGNEMRHAGLPGERTMIIPCLLS